MFRQRVLLASFAALIAGALAQPSAAQTYPSQPIKIIVPTAPGGVADIVGRTTFADLVRDWREKQTEFVLNWEI